MLPANARVRTNPANAAALPGQHLALSTGSGNVCRQCCTEYTDVRTDAFCFLAVDNDIQIKHCGGYSAVNNGGWMAALPTKRTYKDGTVKEIKSCLAGSYTEEMCNFHLKKYPIGETNSEKNCRGY